MKRVLLLYIVVLCLITQFGCSLDTDTSFQDGHDTFSKEKIEYDILLTSAKGINSKMLNDVCSNFESDTGIKIGTDFLNEDNYIEDLRKALNSDNYPSLILLNCAEREEDLKNLNLITDFFKINNNEFQKKISSANDKLKVFSENNECYGFILKNNDFYDTYNAKSKNMRKFICVNSRCKDLEKKLSTDFIGYLIDQNVS